VDGPVVRWAFDYVLLQVTFVQGFDLQRGQWLSGCDVELRQVQFEDGFVKVLDFGVANDGAFL